MKLIKYIIIVPVYAFLILAVVIGWADNKDDIWDDLVKWAKKQMNSV